jgi:hypothetical protein
MQQMLRDVNKRILLEEKKIYIRKPNEASTAMIHRIEKKLTRLQDKKLKKPKT